jgi:hypothetical protein
MGWENAFAESTRRAYSNNVGRMNAEAQARSFGEKKVLYECIGFE